MVPISDYKSYGEIKIVYGDHGGQWDVVRELPDNWFLLKSAHYGVYAFGKITGRKINFTGSAGPWVRLAIYEAEDVGKVNFKDVVETLRPVRKVDGGKAFLV